MNLQDKINLINATYRKVQAQQPKLVQALYMTEAWVCPTCEVEIVDLFCPVCGDFLPTERPEIDD